MVRFRTLAVAGAAALGLAGAVIAGPHSPAAAAGDAEIGKLVLDMLCTSRGGSPYYTPYTISRCQDARARQGFAVEQLICEGLLDGSFQSVSSPSRPSRVNWSCVHGPVSP